MGITYQLARFAALALLAMSGCAVVSTITPAQINKPAQSYAAVAVGEVSTSDPMWAPYALYFKKGFAEQIAKEGLGSVADLASKPLPASAIMVTGRITEVEEGDAAQRITVGLGAGRKHVQGTFEIKDAQGVTLARFDSREAYSGGAGYGGKDFLDVEDLMKRMGVDTAKATARWTRGQPLEAP